MDNSTSTPLASVSARFVQVVIDWILCLLPIKLAQIAGLLSALPTVDIGVATASQTVYTSVVFIAYTAIMLAASTQTLGMRWMRIACISTTDGGPIGLGRGLLRAVLVSLLLPVVPVLFDSYGRGLHDRAAGSVMVAAETDEASSA